MRDAERAGVRREHRIRLGRAVEPCKQFALRGHVFDHRFHDEIDVFETGPVACRGELRDRVLRRIEPAALDVVVEEPCDAVVRRAGTDYEIDRISRTEYFTLPNKTTQGRPSQYFLDRTITPTMYLWAAPENSTDQIRYYYVRRMQDADTLTNTTDIPFRFLPCMVAGLAYYISLKRAPDRTPLLKGLYEEEFQRAAEEDRDRVPLKLVPGRR